MGRGREGSGSRVAGHGNGRLGARACDNSAVNGGAMTVDG